MYRTKQCGDTGSDVAFPACFSRVLCETEAEQESDLRAELLLNSSAVPQKEWLQENRLFCPWGGAVLKLRAEGCRL